ncbi:MAG: hypothetical protein OXE05_09155 [Chloroflexi bacterium]|nr:hypothetical protein [Chloroflexota bacterium]
MSTKMQKFSSQADSELLAALRAIAKQDGRHFHAILEDAMRDYIEARRQDKPRTAVMAHFRASLEKNRRLGELLAK